MKLQLCVGPVAVCCAVFRLTVAKLRLLRRNPDSGEAGRESAARARYMVRFIVE
jgi:hypothetical protein